MDPINYSAQVQSPFMQAIQGYQLGSAIRNDQQQQTAAEQQRAAQQAAAEQQRQMQAELAAASTDLTKIPGLMVRYPQLADKLKTGWETMNADQQRASLSQSSEVAAALASGRPDLATGMLKSRAEALRTSGDERGAKAAEMAAQWAETHPDSLLTATVARLSVLPGGEKLGKSIIDMAQERRAAAKLPAEQRTAEAEAKIKEAAAAVAPRAEAQKLQSGAANIANINSQIAERAARLGLDNDKLMSEMQVKMAELGQQAGKLSPGAEKLVGDSIAAATVSDQAAIKSLTLADQFESLGAGGFGTGATLAEKFKSITGNQGAWTEARQEFLRLKNAMVVKGLPPGPATDRDITLFSAGFPKETSDSAYLASWLRGMAKTQQREAALESARAEWVSAAGTAGTTRRDIEVAGVQVPAGATFDRFARQFVDKFAARRGAEDAATVTNARGYMKYGTNADKDW